MSFFLSDNLRISIANLNKCAGISHPGGSIQRNNCQISFSLLDAKV